MLGGAPTLDKKGHLCVHMPSCLRHVQRSTRGYGIHKRVWEGKGHPWAMNHL